MSRYSDDTLVLALVRQAKMVLNKLGLPDTFTIDQLHQRIERQRGRPIHVIPYPMPPQGPHGMWVMGTTDDYVFIDQNTPQVRMLQIIGHEFGHIIFNDQGGATHLAALTDLLPETPSDTVTDAGALALNTCTRTVYDDMIEQRSEWFGTVVVQRIDHSAPLLLPAPNEPTRRWCQPS
jgi:hypothetical protein